MLSQLKLELLPFHCHSRLHFFSTSIHAAGRLTEQSCILLLQNCKSMNQLEQIQARVLRLGLHQNKDTLNKLMTFCADPSLGNLQHAEKIFSDIQEPWLLVYNVMIKGFAKKGSFRKTIMFFNKLRKEGLSPDNFTYPFVFQAICSLREVWEGQKAHGVVAKSGNGYDSYVCNSLMNMYAELGLVGNMRQVFDEMPERDVVSWNLLISGYFRFRRFEDALSVYSLMPKEGNVRPDEATVVTILSSCVALKDLEFGRQVHGYVNEELEFTVIIGTALLNLYTKCGCLSVARNLFDEMPNKNVRSYTIMLSGYLNFGQLNEARDLFERSPVKDTVLWTAMINGYVQFNRSDEGMALFRQMQIRKVKPDKFTAVSLLTGCAQLGALEQGKWIHNYIDENNIPIDAIVGTALIEMYAKCGRIDKSLEIFDSLKQKDAASWTSIICGLAMNGKTGDALDLFSRMVVAGVTPDDITFVGVLSACSHGGLIEEGRKYFISMKRKYHIEPKLEHYGCMVDLLGRAGLLAEAADLIEQIPHENDKITVPLYGALLSACRTYGNVEMGERVSTKLMKIESGNSGIHTLLANIYASAERWKDVTKVRRKMKSSGVKKVPGCSSIELNGIVHEFIVGDASHNEMKEVCSLLDCLMKELDGWEESEMEDLSTTFE